MNDILYSPDNQEFLWRKKIIKYYIGDIVGSLTVLHHEELSKIVALDKNEVIKRYFPLQEDYFFWEPSVPENAITDRDIEDKHKKTHNKKWYITWRREGAA